MSVGLAETAQLIAIPCTCVCACVCLLVCVSACVCVCVCANCTCESGGWAWEGERGGVLVKDPKHKTLIQLKRVCLDRSKELERVEGELLTRPHYRVPVFPLREGTV